jgi:hypothetical protein
MKLSDRGPQPASDCWSHAALGPSTGGRSLAAAGCSNLILCNLFFIPIALVLLCMWSTLVGWLELMPALPKLL